MFLWQRFFIVLLAVSVIPLMSRCNFFADEPPLVIASHVWPGYELMFLARHEKWLPADALILQETQSATASLQALIDGKVDGAALTLDEMLRARARGVALTAVLVFDVSVGADVVLAKPAVKNLADLAGKRIGVEQSSVGALMLYKMLAAAGLQQEAVRVVQMSMNNNLEALWHSGQLDALITYEPVASQLLAQDAHLLFDSRKIPNTIFDVLAVTTQAMQQKPQAIKALIDGHFHALAHFRTNPKDAAYRMAERLHIAGNQVPDTFRGLDLPDVAANRKFLAANDNALLKVAKILSTLITERHLIAKEDDLTHLVSADFLPEDK